MKAIICTEPGSIEKLSFGQLPKPQPAHDEVLIEIHYAGINYPDILISEGKYQFKPEGLFSPGGEASGVVVEKGPSVNHLDIGDTVCAAMSWGGYAEFVVAKESNTFKIPNGVDMAQASILLETYATALYALKDRAFLKSSEKLVVLGAAGGTGTAAIQLAKLFGVEIIAICSTKEKCQFAQSNGASTLNSTTDDIKSELKSAGGIDVIFDPVGGDLAELCFRALKPNGRHLVVGFASGQIPKISWNLPLLKSASVIGVFWGYYWRNEPDANRKNVEMLLSWLAEEKISPVIHKLLPLSKAVEGLQMLKKRQVLGKLVLDIKNVD